MSTNFEGALFKYFPFSGLDRFQKSWSLRLTPPREFNDPFEFYPSIDSFFDAHDVVPEFKRLAPAMFVRDLTAKMLPQFGGMLVESEVDRLNGLLLVDGDEDAIRTELDYFVGKLPGFPVSNFLMIRREISSVWPNLMAQADVVANAMMPTVNKEIRAALVENLVSKMGVVCLSHAGNQPLMWSHYADSHRGAMVVFDSKSASLTGKVKPKGRMGMLNDVTYTAVRPMINYRTVTDINLFQAYTLTKSTDWEYERECRLILELTEADSVEKGDASDIYLLSIQPSAVRSIVFGCNVDLQLRDGLIDSMRNTRDAEHLSFYQSYIDQEKYFLNYVELVI